MAVAWLISSNRNNLGTTLKTGLLRIEPRFYSRIWGSRSLLPLYSAEQVRDGKNGATFPIGEAWLTANECRVAGEAWKGDEAPGLRGKTLAEAWQEMPEVWRGTRMKSEAVFPLLVKFIFPREKLSIQVHPNDSEAALLEPGSKGKTEMWHVVSADPGAKLLLGLNQGVTAGALREGIAAGDLEGLFRSYSVQEGDTFFVPAGMPHTIGANMVICEVQQHSDITYRVYDYARVDDRGQTRELHLDKALQVLKFDGSAGGLVPSVAISAPGENRTLLLTACRYFAAERWELRTAFNARSDSAQFDLLTVLSGSGNFKTSDSAADFRPGECWLVPANLGRYRVNPRGNTVILRSFVPDLIALRRNLADQQIADEAIEKVIFDA